jgi:hypothetical protein
VFSYRTHMASSPVSSRRTSWLVRIILALWLLPAIQTVLNMKILRPTRAGFEATAPRPDISWRAWWAGSLQPAAETYSTQKLGLREWLAKPYNQLLYNAFGKSTNTQVVQGQRGMLFEAGPLQAALGHQLLADEAQVAAQVRTLRAVQDTLARRGKLLVYVIAPSKPTLYPENLPDSCQRLWPRTTAYDRYRGPMQAAGLNVLDFMALFKIWKPRSPYPLFPSGGIHWSSYGATRAADTLWRYLEARGHFRLPRVRQTGLEVSTTPRYTDDDLMRLLNLWVAPAPTPPLAYPTLVFDPPRAGERRPRLLLIADSFGWSFIEFYPYLEHLFAPSSAYWYYNHEVVWPKVNGQISGPPTVASRDLRADLDAHDVVLLLFNTANMSSFASTKPYPPGGG